MVLDGARENKNMEKSILITMSSTGELKMEKKGITDVLEIVGILELVKTGEVIAAMTPAPSVEPKSPSVDPKSPLVKV